MLHDPFSLQMKSLLETISTTSSLLRIRDLVCFAGTLGDCELDMLNLTLMNFSPGKGFVTVQDFPKTIQVKIPGVLDRAFRFIPDMQIVCCGKITMFDDHEMCLASDAIVCPRPSFDHDLALNFMHVFAGSFSGWSQAANWLGRANVGHAIGQQIYIDCDQTVMELWSAKHMTRPYKAPVPPQRTWNPAAHVGIHALASDFTVLHLSANCSNLIMTLSPPCPTWSRGGRSQALSHPGGWAFVESLELALIAQPNFISAECVDEIVFHPHFAFVQEILQRIGYCRVFSQNVNHHLVSNHMRNRWLATWVRHDHAPFVFDGRFTIQTIPRKPWHSERYAFRIPSVWESQLKLVESELEKYGDEKLLPNAKRKCLPNKFTPADVLELRFPKLNEVLPTLCASCTSQHELATHHIEDKGIFAFLENHHRGISFFAPLRFCSLFGACEMIVFPNRIQEAFRGVGNAITVQHALLAIVLGLQALTKQNLNVSGLIQRSWDDRLINSNSVVFTEGDFVFLAPIDHAIRSFVTPQPTTTMSGEVEVTLAIPQCWCLCSARFAGDASLEFVLRQRLKGPIDLISQISIQVSTHSRDLKSSLAKIAKSGPVQQLVINCVQIGSIEAIAHSFESPTSDAPLTEVIISPTAPFEAQHVRDSEVPQQIDIPCIDFEGIVSTKEFQMFLTAIEKTQSDVTSRPHQISILCPDIPTVLTATVDVWHVNPFKFRLQQSSQASQGKLFSVDNTATTGGSDLLVLQSRCDPPQDPVVFLESETVDLLAIKCYGIVSLDTIFNLHNNPLAISTINGSVPQDSIISLRDGDRILLKPSTPILAGGHHGYRGIPMTLNAGATFAQRAAYATDSHGWLATDELHFITKMIQEAGDNSLIFSPPIYWDVSQDDFEESPFGDLYIDPNIKTVVPILHQAHWGAVEIERIDNRAHINICQIAQRFHDRLVRILARRLDLGTQRLVVHVDFTVPPPHLCGWMLINKWITEAQVIPWLPDIVEALGPRPQAVQELIDLVLNASLENWRDARATPTVALIAAKLRRDFLCAIYQEVQGLPSVEHEIISAFPFHYVQPPEGPQIIMLSTHTMPFKIEERIQERFSHLFLHKGWMATDEFDFLCEFASQSNPETLIAPAAIWCPVRRVLVFPQKKSLELRPYGHIIWPVIFQHHWIQFEVYRATQFNHVNLLVTAPTSIQQLIGGIVTTIINELNVIPSNVTITYVTQVTPNDLCGYALTKDMFERIEAGLPHVPDQIEQCLRLSQHNNLVARVRQGDQQVWDQSGADDALKEFARRLRTLFLHRVINNDFPHDYFAAGVEANNAPKSPSKAAPARAAAPADKIDTLWVNDPWKPKSKPKAQARWEDLLLHEDHPFKGADGKAVDQIHRLQASPWRGGIVLATKSNLQEILHLDPQGYDLAIVLPASDPSTFGSLAGKLEGPHEVVLRDVSSNTTYKRLILLLVVKGKVVYQLPKPTVQFTTPHVSELVLEIDERFVSKSDYAHYKEQPIPTFRKLTAAILGEKSNEFIFYGFRVNHHPSAAPDSFQLQCIVKIPLDSRAAFLEASGRSILFVRDYLERGQGSLDTSVLPKFWPPSAPELQNMLIATKDTSGAAGIVIARRGLALRVWSTKIGAARSTLLAGDPRITKDNQDVVPKHVYEAAGWPVGSTAANVVHATLQATKAAPIPTRTFRVAGVVTWILAFDRKPGIDRFTIEANGIPHEILLRESAQGSLQKPPAAKGIGKKGKQAKTFDPAGGKQSQFVPVQPGNSQDSARIDRLEERFNNFEVKHSRFEEKVDSRFEHISDSLRQLLQTVGPSRSREITGETPPAKQAKQT